jgi:hypothetical protein
MATCPECGFTNDGTEDGHEWFVDIVNQDKGGRHLVVCPSCDVVLGATNWAYK